MKHNTIGTYAYDPDLLLLLFLELVRCLLLDLEAEEPLLLLPALLVLDFLDVLVDDFFVLLLELFDDLLLVADFEDFEDLAAFFLSSFESRDFLLSEEDSTVSRFPLATENARKVAMNRTPLKVRYAFALKRENLETVSPPP